MKNVVLLALAALMSSPVHADLISPTHNCSKPVVPTSVSGAGEVASVQRRISVYKQCLADFIAEQERQARMHIEAARKAGEELRRI